MLRQKILPRLCFVGPLLGRNPGWVVSQGEIQAELFSRAGYPVLLTSTIPNRIIRLADIVRSLLAWRQKIDLVIVMVFSGQAFGIADVASRLVRGMGAPLVFWLHGGNLPEFSRRHPYWTQSVLRRGDALVSPSGYLANFYQQQGLGVNIIPNVLEIDQTPFQHRQQVRPHLLWMRTFHELYHPEMAVNVLHRVQKTYPQACLTMAGQDKGHLEPVKQLVRQYGLESSVRFVGFLDQAGKQREFANHDIFLNTNRVDNMPVSVIEAAAFGLPVVATAIGGIPYLLQHNQNGLLVPDGDVEGMAAAVERLVSDPGLVAQLSANGRRLAEACVWPVVKTQWESLFEKILYNS